MRLFRLQTDAGIAITMGPSESSAVTSFVRKHDGQLVLTLKDGGQRIVGRGDAALMLTYLKDCVLGSRIEPDVRYVAKPGPKGCTFAEPPRPTQGALQSLQDWARGNGAGASSSEL